MPFFFFFNQSFPSTLFAISLSTKNHSSENNFRVKAESRLTRSWTVFTEEVEVLCQRGKVGSPPGPTPPPDTPPTTTMKSLKEQASLWWYFMEACSSKRNFLFFLFLEKKKRKKKGPRISVGRRRSGQSSSLCLIALACADCADWRLGWWWCDHVSGPHQPVPKNKRQEKSWSRHFPEKEKVFFFLFFFSLKWI